MGIMTYKNRLCLEISPSIDNEHINSVDFCEQVVLSLEVSLVQKKIVCHGVSFESIKR